MDIKEIQNKISVGKYFLSQHAIRESSKDGIEDEDIEKAILNSIIIENYSDDPRGESCLICGKIENGRFIHVVIGKQEEDIIIITVYIPTLPKWVTPFKRGG